MFGFCSLRSKDDIKRVIETFGYKDCGFIADVRYLASDFIQDYRGL